MLEKVESVEIFSCLFLKFPRKTPYVSKKFIFFTFSLITSLHPGKKQGSNLEAGGLLVATIGHFVFPVCISEFPTKTLS